MILNASDGVTNIMLFASANARIAGADPGVLKFLKELKNIWSIVGEHDTAVNAINYSLKIFVIDQRNS